MPATGIDTNPGVIGTDISLEVCLDVAGVMIVFVDADETVRLVNLKGQEILGHSEEEIVGANWFDTFLPARIREDVRQVFRELLGEGIGTNEYGENVVLTAGGDERWMRWHNAVVRGDDGTVLGTLSSGADVTECRSKEEALRASEARSRAILDTTVDGIITADERGRIESFNPAAERIFGYRADEAIGRNIKMLMPSPYRDEHDAYMRSYVQTGDRKVIGIGREVVGKRKDGTTFPMELAVSEVYVAGRRFLTGVIRDISDRRALEREVLRISEEERRRIGRDLHDGLGSLLSGAAMGVQALVRKLQSGESIAAEDLERVADMLDEGADQAHVLARGLNPVRLETEGLVAALKELAGNVRTVSGLACNVISDAELRPVNTTVAAQLYRIAQEAVTNAVKHAKASQITLELDAQDGWLKLTVRDDGVGLSTNETHEGLGMHIMPYRARLINAHFSIERAADGGTIVSCLAPLGGQTPID